VAKSRILGIDPGTTFSAYSIIDVTITENKVTNIKWICSGLFRNLLKNVDSTTQVSARPFIKDIRELLNKYSPQIIVMESFMQRSFRSNLASPISIMLGLVLGMAERRKLKYISVMPSTWKRQLERDFKKVDDVYDLTYPIKQRLPPHVIDSFFQALFAAGDKCYQSLKQRQIDIIKKKIKVSGTLLADIEHVNKQELERKKSKKKRKRKKT
jgi:Holliday junction resolvasome RuvABC endonuclease subunit